MFDLWVCIVSLRCCSHQVLTLADCLPCREYINRLIVSLRDDTENPEVSDLSVHAVGVIVVFLLAGLNLASKKTGTMAQVFITILKVNPRPRLPAHHRFSSTEH